MERHAGRIGTPKMKEINEYYRKHRAQLLIPECVRGVAHIVKLMNDTATEVPRRLRGDQSEYRAGS